MFQLRDEVIAQEFGEIVPKRPQTEDLTSIIEAVRQNRDGARRTDIAKVLGDVPQRTLQYRLKSLIDSGQLTKEGKGPAARYQIANAQKEQQAAAAPEAGLAAEPSEDAQLPLSEEGAKIRDYVRQPHGSRKAVGYNRQFLDSYRPNASFYLSPEERAHLADVGKTRVEVEAAGTYAKQILDRLLIDLSWNSSRLEGNTYSLLDTRRLIEFGEETPGRNRLEAQMILNHKDAIAFLEPVRDFVPS